MTRSATCSAYVERASFCSNGFPQTPACRPMQCHGCRRFSDALPWCQREDIPERWLRPNGLPFIGVPAQTRARSVLPQKEAEA
jgi:hypothetical protein